MSDTERASRQELVVPPRQSNLPVILGACVCGCAGFGLVWAFGIGRSMPTSEPADLTTAAVAPAEPGPAKGWHPPATDPDEQPETDRYPNRSVSFESPTGIVRTGGTDRGLSRFSAPADLESLPEAATTDLLPAEEADSPTADEIPPPLPEPDEPAATEPAATEPVPPQSEQSTPSITIDELDGSAASEKPAPDPAVKSRFPVSTDLEPLMPLAEPMRMPRDTGDATEHASDTPSPLSPPATVAEADTTPADPAPATPPHFDDPADAPLAGATETAPAASAASAFATAGAATSAAATSRFATPPPAPPPPPFPPATPSGPTGLGPQSFAGPQPTSQSGLATTGFGLPPRPAIPAHPVTDTTSLQPLPSGDGRPGPAALEGVQAPQLTVEKRGPQEVQVGKPARYEMFIRNVGTAVAHDVTLHDTVPAGTRLIATTPPAAPGQASDPSGMSGDLVWRLGTLDPGAGTKVAMEVMPETEGEIGSVASVTFRADATMRSRSTKPGLQIESSTPEPVLIGKEITTSIVVSNPGTGTATGVVLVGTLPDGVRHPAGNEVEFDVGRLEPGERRTIDLTLASTSPGVHAMTVTARGDGRLSADASIPLEVTAPMLELAADMPGRRYLQRPATCRITMHNTGTAPALGVELATQLPPGMKFVRANNAGFYDERHNRVLWSLEELPPGETGTVELVVMPVALGPQKLLTAARNPAGLSDQIANTIEVDGLASLTFEIADSEDPIEVGGQTEYVIRVGNQGTKPASGVRLAATLLGDLEPVEASGPSGHRIENLTVFFEPLATLVPTEEATFKIRIRGRRAGDHRVQVQLTSDDHAAPITKEEVTRVYADR